MAEIESEQFIVVYLNYQLIELKNNFQLFSQFVNEVARHPDLSCSTPSGIIGNIRPHATIHAPEPISFNFLNQGISSFTQNELQIEASNQLYGLIDQMKGITDNNLMKDWNNLQVIDHFYYMDTSFFDDDNASKFNNPYDSPYDAFINYMNILNDFKLRIGQNTENTQA
jgi:alpha-amylase